MRTSQRLAVVLVTGMFAVACNDQGPPTAAEAAPGSAQHQLSAQQQIAPAPPILVEPLTARHEFTDDVAAQIRLKPEGRPRNVVNLQDASHMAVLRFTVQPGVRFPWHTHPGLVLVTVTQGELVYVYGDDCVRRTYPAGTAFVDPGNNVHPTGGETVLVATFLGVPATGPLTLPVVAAAESTALDSKCGVAAASHMH